MSNFLSKLNSITDNKFTYLRLGEVNMDDDEALVSIHFIIPYEIFNDKFTVDDKVEISNACEQLMPAGVKVKIYYEKLMLIQDVVVKYINEFIRTKYFKLFDERYLAKDIAVRIKDGLVSIKIPVDTTIYSFCIARNIKNELECFLDSKYNAKNFVTISEIEMPKEYVEKRKEKEIYIDDGLVVLQKGSKIIGESFSSPALYIARYKEPTTYIVTVCGTVTKIDRKISKRERLFYPFVINDSTGTMNCVYFSNGKSKSSFDCVKVGEDIVLQGELREDTFRKSVTLFVKNAAMAKIDYDTTKKKIELIKREQKKSVVPEPKPYIDSTKKEEDITLFSEQEYICPLLREKEFVVFDLETTGTNTNSDKIAEIGAAKISHGEIVSTFTTLVDPEMLMPAQATFVNHIHDEMLLDAPFIRDVIGKFVKYCDGCCVVGHNAKNFDIPIVQREAKVNGYLFDNEAYDTLELQRRINPRGKASLETLVELYQIDTKNTHRALADALATAKLFIILANKLKLE